MFTHDFSNPMPSEIGQRTVNDDVCIQRGSMTGSNLRSRPPCLAASSEVKLVVPKEGYSKDETNVGQSHSAT